MSSCINYNIQRIVSSAVRRRPLPQIWEKPDGWGVRRKTKFPVSRGLRVSKVSKNLDFRNPRSPDTLVSGIRGSRKPRVSGNCGLYMLIYFSGSSNTKSLRIHRFSEPRSPDALVSGTQGFPENTSLLHESFFSLGHNVLY